MEKLLWLAIAASLACKLILGRWPWAMLRGAMALPSKGTDPKRPAPPVDLSAARALLGVEPEASRQTITEAHKRVMMAAHPDQGGSKLQAQEANAARDLLLADCAARQQGPA